MRRGLRLTQASKPIYNEDQLENEVFQGPDQAVKEVRVIRKSLLAPEKTVIKSSDDELIPIQPRSPGRLRNFTNLIEDRYHDKKKYCTNNWQKQGFAFVILKKRA